MPKALIAIGISLLLTACGSVGLSDAERVWCADNSLAVVGAAIQLDLYKQIDLPKATPWTYDQFLEAVTSGRVDWFHTFSGQGGYLTRMKSGEVASIRLGNGEAPDPEAFVAQVRAALRNGGLAEDSVKELQSLDQPLADADRERACKAAFAAR